MKRSRKKLVPNDGQRYRFSKEWEAWFEPDISIARKRRLNRFLKRNPVRMRIRSVFHFRTYIESITTRTPMPQPEPQYIFAKLHRYSLGPCVPLGPPTRVTK